MRIKHCVWLLIMGQLAYMPQGISEEMSQQTQQRQGVVVLPTNITELPANQGKTLAVLKVDESIIVLNRERAWYQVSTEKNLLGWLNMLNVRLVNAAKREGEVGFSALLGSATKNTDPTVSTGIRGFDDEDIKQAKADMKQVELLNNYVVSIPTATNFAQAGLLVANNIIIKEVAEK